MRSTAAAGLAAVLAAPWHLQAVHLLPDQPARSPESIRTAELLTSRVAEQRAAQEQLRRMRGSERAAVAECGEKSSSAVFADSGSFTILPDCESGEVGHTRNTNLAAHQWLWARDHVRGVRSLREQIDGLDSEIRRRYVEIKSLREELVQPDAAKQAEDHASAQHVLGLLRVATLGAIGAFASGLWRRCRSGRMLGVTWFLASASASLVVAGILVSASPFQGSVVYSIALMSGLVLDEAIEAVKGLAKKLFP